MRKIFLFFLINFFFSIIQLNYADTLIVEPDQGREPLLHAIQHSQHNIEMVMYGLTDKRMIDALTSAKQNKAISILIEPHPYKNETENESTIRKLQSAKITVNLANPRFRLTHQKTFMFDHHTAAIMNFNLTVPTFKSERNFAIIISDPSEINEIEKVFHADINRQTFTPTHPNLIWSPDNSRTKLLQLLQSAKHHIELYEQTISDYEIVGVLARLARAGISIKIISSFDENVLNGKLRYLRKAGMIIHDRPNLYIHAKAIIIDHKLAIIGSTNLTKASLDENRELSVVTRDPGVIMQLEKVFQRDFVAVA